MSPSIIVIIDYFGEWPEWFPLFIESCRWNPTITWLFHTDCHPYAERLDNVHFEYMTWKQYQSNISAQLGIRFRPLQPYKICDIRPALGEIYERDIRGYDFFGYGDLDVLYGNIREFYDDATLKGHDVLSTHRWCLSGHFALIRNTEYLRNAFRLVPWWHTTFEDPMPRRFDEDDFTKVLVPFKPPIPQTESLADGVARCHQNVYFVEQFTTPLTPSKWLDGGRDHPEVWSWQQGRVTNTRDGARRFIYLHFMNYCSARFMDRKYGQCAPWAGMSKVLHLASTDVHKGICIDRSGFHALSDSSR